MHCGVRQGCPISPLLFAAAVDVLLRRLQQKLPEGHLRAFADDIGLVVEEWARDWGLAQNIFQEFAEMSGLELNIPKTVCIPLWPQGIQEVSNNPSLLSSRWSPLKIAGSGKYLGFSSGPEKGHDSWSAPLAKYSKRVRKWQGEGLGAQFSVLAYNSLTLSTLLFVAQLENPPEEVLAAETACIRKMLGGPGQWFNIENTHHLKECFGQKYSYGSLALISQAAQLTVVHSHNIACCNGSILDTSSIFNMYRRLLNLREDHSTNFQRVGTWRSWYDGAHVAVLACNEIRLRASGLGLSHCLHAIAGAPRPWPRKVREKQKRTLQK